MLSLGSWRQNETGLKELMFSGIPLLELGHCAVVSVLLSGDTLVEFQKLTFFIVLNPHFKRGFNQSLVRRSCALLFVNNWNTKECDCVLHWEVYPCPPVRTEREGHRQGSSISHKAPETPRRGWSGLWSFLIGFLLPGAESISSCEEAQEQTLHDWELLFAVQEGRQALMKMVMPALGKYWLRKSPCLKSLHFKGKGTNTC